MIIDLTKIPKLISPHFLPLLYDKSRYIVLRGSTGSGKSHFLAQKILLRILSDWNITKHRILVIRKTLPSAKDSTFTLLKNYIDKWNITPFIRSITSNPTCFTFTNGSEILVRGLDQPEKIKSIEGISSIWLEEANQFTQGDFDELDRRLRGDVGTYKQIMISFNPVSKYNWLYKHFYAKTVPNTTLHHSTFKDNPYIMCDKEYVQVLEQYKNSTNNYNYTTYYLGEWGVKEGLIYTNWEPIDKMPLCDTVCYGTDYGFGAETAVVKLGKQMKDDKIIYVELLLYKKGVTNNDLISWFKSELSNSVDNYADAAEPDRILDARRAGINIKPANKKPGSVNAGIDYLQGHQLRIVKNQLFDHAEKEITSYSYDETKDGTAKEKPGTKSPDHFLDALRYGAYTAWANNIQYRILT